MTLILKLWMYLKAFEQGTSWSSAITERIQVKMRMWVNGSSLGGSRLAQPYKVAARTGLLDATIPSHHAYHMQKRRPLSAVSDSSICTCGSWGR